MKSAKTRTLTQNSSIHKYCAMLSEAFNAAGLDMQTVLAEGTSIPWSEAKVKEDIWRTVQIAALGKKSTTELNTNYDIEFANAKINEIQALISQFQANSSSVIGVLGRNADRETDINKQNAIQELSQDVQQYSATVNRYSSELGKYREDIQKQVQEHNLNLQAYINDSTAKIQDFASQTGHVNTKHDGLLKEMANLKNLYEQEITLYLG